MAAKIRDVFAELNKGNYEPVLATLAPEFEHCFAGEHCLGGTRTTTEAYRRWFERLFAVFPDIHFEIRNLVVQGWPWDTIVAIEWYDTLTTRDGVRRRNQGAHFIRFRWAKAVEIRIYIDTQRVEQFLEVQARHGVAAATAPPVLDAGPGPATGSPATHRR